MNIYEENIKAMLGYITVGTGSDVSILVLAKLVAKFFCTVKESTI